MSKFIHINNIFKQINRKSVRIWIDKLSYLNILIIWVFVIVSLGLVYFFSQNSTSFLFYGSKGGIVNNIKDAIYFSFVTATTTGFGDIIPFGSFKLIAVLEVVLGLMLLAVVASKLVSIKQDIILNELYELSFNEKVNKLRSSLLLFRQNLDRVVSKIEDNSIKKREINEIYIYLSSLEDILNETLYLITRSSSHHYVKNIDAVNTELIFNSILNSFEKLHELILVMNQNKTEWKTEINIDYINKGLVVNEDLFDKLNTSKSLMKQTISDLNLRKNEIIVKIRELIA